MINPLVVANLFFEPSTRTRTSFSLAAKRLSAAIFSACTIWSSRSFWAFTSTVMPESTKRPFVATVSDNGFFIAVSGAAKGALSGRGANVIVGVGVKRTPATKARWQSRGSRKAPGPPSLRRPPGPLAVRIDAACMGA